VPVDDREYVRGSHPPTCSCADCTNRRLRRFRDGTNASFDPLGFGKNPRAKGSSSSGGWKVPSTDFGPPHWLKALLLVFAASVIGLIVSALARSYVPFWPVFGFSIFYSIERWFYYLTRRHRALGKLYRVLMNLSLLALLGLLVWLAVKLFSHQLAQPPLLGSLMLLSGVALFVWMAKVVSKNSWRWPSMKLTVFSLICLFLVFSFAGVQPMADYTEVATRRIATFVSEQQIRAEARRVAEENRRATEEAEMRAAGVASEYAFYQQYAALFNEFRAENGRQPLVFDPALNQLAGQRAIEISQPGGFSHEGIQGYNLGENIAMMAYSSDSPTSLIRLWANSPGHRSNMLSPDYSRTGFAKNGRYAVQLFG